MHGRVRTGVRVRRAVGGGFCSVIMRTFMGGYLANGALPCANSSSVMPSDLRIAAPRWLRPAPTPIAPSLLHAAPQPPRAQQTLA